MSEKMKISDYKGFELWDTPAPEGWRVHQYPVQVTCNGEHVNCFANAHEAMSVIDGMDADTIAYHMRRAPATAPTAAALEAYPDLYRSGDYSVYYDPEYQEYIVASGGGDPLSARKTLDEAKAIADAYASEGDKAEPTAAAQGEVVPASVDDLSPAQKEVWVRLALNQADVQIASLEAALQQAQRERDAANELLAKIERRMPMVQPFDLGVHYYSETYNAWLVGDWIRAYQKAASAQQAAQPADGEG